MPTSLLDLSSIEVFDFNNLDSLPDVGFYRWTSLRVLVLNLAGLRVFPSEPFRVCNRLTYVEISSSPLLTLTVDLFVGATSLAHVRFIGNSAMPDLPSGLFDPVSHSLESLTIR